MSSSRTGQTRQLVKKFGIIPHETVRRWREGWVAGSTVLLTCSLEPIENSRRAKSIPQGPKYTIFEASSSKYHTSSGFGDQEPPILGAWIF